MADERCFCVRSSALGREFVLERAARVALRPVLSHQVVRTATSVETADAPPVACATAPRMLSELVDDSKDMWMLVHAAGGGERAWTPSRFAGEEARR